MISKLNLFVIILFLFAEFFLASNAFGALGDCPDAISAYWELDETTAGLYVDTIGANDGACSGAGCPGGITENIGNAQSFDGTGDAITVPADSAFNWSAAQSFTIELWMRRNTGPVDNGLEVFIGRAAAAGLNWYLGINGSGYAQVQLKAADGSGPGVLTVSRDLRSASATWHHVALVRDAATDTNTLYVDGDWSESQSPDYTAGFNSDTAPLTLGARDNGNFFNGGLDEVAVYARALTDNEIRSHYYVSRGYCSRYDSPLKIMPLGDSITAGVWTADVIPTQPLENVRVGYRYDLWQLLGSNLFWFDYIGSEQAGYDVDPDFDADHAGFPGYTDTQINTLLSGGYLDNNATDMILLHIGTNGIDIDQSADDVDAILDQIDLHDQNITVLLARIIDQSPNNVNVSTFNTNITNMANTRKDQGDKIIIIDMHAALTYGTVPDPTPPYSNDMYDDLHPNPSGYNKMAGQWFATLESILPQSEIPVITSTAITAAVKDQAYTYTVTATGPPAPTFELTVNPAGMTINPATGLIQWTPSAAGDEAVTVQAVNWTGTDTQTFTLAVNALPQAVGDAYSGVDEGGTLNVSAAQGVLSNDSDENDTLLTAILAGNATHGTVDLSADGSFTYTHDGSENFSDSFTYMANDGKGNSAPATVTLTITPVDDPPAASGGGGGGGGCFIATLF